MTLDSLKNKWKSATDTPSDRSENVRRVAAELVRMERSHNAADWLSRRYLRMGILAFIVPVVLVPLNKTLDMSPVVNCIYVLTMIVLGIANLSVWYRLKHARVYDLPVVEAARTVIGLRRYAFRCRLFGEVIAVPCLVMLFMEFAREDALLWGGITGLVIGLIIAIINVMRNRRAFREMAAPFED